MKPYLLTGLIAFTLCAASAANAGLTRVVGNSAGTAPLGQAMRPSHAPVDASFAFAIPSFVPRSDITLAQVAGEYLNGAPSGGAAAGAPAVGFAQSWELGQGVDAPLTGLAVALVNTGGKVVGPTDGSSLGVGLPNTGIGIGGLSDIAPHKATVVPTVPAPTASVLGLIGLGLLGLTRWMRA